MSSQNTRPKQPKDSRYKSKGKERKFTPRKRSETEGDNSCVLCAQNIEIYAVGFCDHPICFRCSAKMRILCEQTECAVCRKDLKKIIYSKSNEKFSALNKFTLKGHTHHGVFFTNLELKEKYSNLFLNCCHLCKGSPHEKNFNDLQKHMRKEHDLHYCDLCIKHNMNFVDELKAYSRKDLARHRRIGDEDDTSHKGHPNCEFCDERYLDSDHLLKHLRTDHYYCHFCDKAGLNQYYDGYSELRTHFRSEHYLCEEDNCINEEFTSVFETELDLKAHRAKEHRGNLSRQQQKIDRNIDLGFQYTRPSRGRGRNDLGRSGMGYSKNSSNRNQESKEDHDIALALELSLQDSNQSKQSNQRERKYRVERPKPRGEVEDNSPPTAKPEENVQLTRMDFPALGAAMEVKPAYVLGSDIPRDVVAENIQSKPVPVNSESQITPSETASAATVVAFAAGISTGKSRYNENDFPTLGGASSKKSTPQNATWIGSSKPKANRNVGPVSVNIPQSSQYHKKVNITNNNDFPSLGNESSKLTPGGNFWGNVVTVPISKSKPSMVKVTPKPAPATQQTIKKNNFKPVGQDNVIYHNDVTVPLRMGSKKHAVHVTVEKRSGNIEDVELPTEVPGIFGDTNIKTVTAEAFSALSGNSKHVNANHNNFSMENDEFPSLGGSKRSDTLFPSSIPQRNTKPNQKKKKTRPNSNVTLTDISKDLLSNENSKNISKSPSPVERTVPEKWDDDELLDVSNKEDSMWPHENNQISKNNEIFNGDETMGIKSNKNQYNLEVEDFPSLGGLKQSAMQENKKKVTGNKKKKKKKNKGIQSAADINKHFPRSFVNLEADEPSNLDLSENVLPIGTKLTLSSVITYDDTYSKPEVKVNEQNNKKPGNINSQKTKLPPGFVTKPGSDNPQEKNMWLIETIQRLCKTDETFSNFKSTSGEFRQGSITAKQYYNNCIKLLGAANFTAISTELVDLLPEEEKRNELRREIEIAT